MKKLGEISTKNMADKTYRQQVINLFASVTGQLDKARTQKTVELPLELIEDMCEISTGKVEGLYSFLSKFASNTMSLFCLFGLSIIYICTEVSARPVLSLL